MKKLVLISTFITLAIGAFILIGSFNNDACAGSKCHYKMVCGGNSNIKATVCAEDCNDSSTKEEARQWFKKKCSSASKPSNYRSGHDDCDVTL
ncbi:MAG: hypothetical protein GY754_16980 [bacterium]|nr:hypothetical protein [bacterium]